MRIYGRAPRRVLALWVSVAFASAGGSEKGELRFMGIRQSP